jgi:Holliday junction resolvase RusA-like endonuclease
MTVLFRGRLPLPPGINQSYKPVHIARRDGREYSGIGSTRELLQFKKDAAKELLQAEVDWQQVDHIRASRRHKIPLACEVIFFFKTMWKRDIDGGEKHCIDAVFEYLKLNDNLLVDLHMKKLIDPNDPHTDVHIMLF